MYANCKPIAAAAAVCAILGTANPAGAQDQTCQEEARALKADAEARMASQPAGSQEGLAKPVEDWFGSPH